MSESGDVDDVRSRSAWAAAAGVYIVYMLVVLAPVWSARVEPGFDGRDFNYPKFAYAIETLRSGHLPLWDPYLNCGQPFFADAHLAWNHPLALVAGFLRDSPLDAYALFWTTTWVWAGLGAFFLAATLGAGPLGSLVAALTFSLSGFFVGNAQHLPHVVTAASLPWVLALGHRAMARERWAYVLFSGVALGLSALGGYPGLVLFEVLALALWLALAFLVPWSGPAREHNSPFQRRLFWFMAATVLPVLILLVIWSPGLYGLLVEARDFTIRAHRPALEEAVNGSPFPLRATISFLFPRVVVQQPAFFRADVSMTNAYVGAIGFPLVAVWLASVGRRGWWLLLFAGLWFWVSLGGSAGLRTVLHYLVPPTDYMRYNAVLRILFMVPLTVVAGLGVDQALARIHGSARLGKFLWVWTAFAVASGFLAVWVFGYSPRLMLAIVPPALLVGIAACVVMAGQALQWNPAIVLRLLVIIIGVDSAWHLYGNSFTVWERAPKPSIREVESWAKNANPVVPRHAAPQLSKTSLNLVIRRPVVEGFVSLISDFNGKLVPSRFNTVLSRHRFWLSPSAVPAPPRDAGLAVLGKLGASDAIPVYVKDPAGAIPGAAVVPSTYGRVEIVSYEPERVELDVFAPGAGAAILASTERFAPSWRLTVDGHAAEVLTVNYFFRGVRVQPGRHRLVFEYRPRAFVALLVLSYAMMIGTVAAAGYLLRRR